MVSLYLGGKYLLDLDRQNNEVSIGNLTGLGKFLFHTELYFFSCLGGIFGTPYKYLLKVKIYNLVKVSRPLKFSVLCLKTISINNFIINSYFR